MIADSVYNPLDPALLVWPTIAQYALAHPCGQCGARAGQPCNAPRKRRTAERYGEPSWAFHGTRQTAACSHYNRDKGKAPWPEDREPGRCYCTIRPCPLI